MTPKNAQLIALTAALDTYDEDIEKVVAHAIVYEDDESFFVHIGPRESIFDPTSGQLVNGDTVYEVRKDTERVIPHEHLGAVHQRLNSATPHDQGTPFVPHSFIASPQLRHIGHATWDENGVMTIEYFDPQEPLIQAIDELRARQRLQSERTINRPLLSERDEPTPSESTPFGPAVD